MIEKVKSREGIANIISRMTYAHRQQMIHTLENLKQSTETPVSACGSELAEENFLASFCLHTGEEISIPTSKKDTRLLEELAVSKEISNWQIEWQIDASEIISLSPPDFSVSQLPQLLASSLADFKEFGQGIESVEANLSHLALYRAVEANDDVDYDAESKHNTSVHNRSGKSKWIGSFGTLVLQIPVTGGFRGGDFRLTNRKRQSKFFSTSRNSHRAFHVTAFYDDCQVFMEPITRGARIDLVFNLRHKDSVTNIARPLSEDHNSPLYRIWQSPIVLQNETHEEAISQLSENAKIFRDLFIHWKKTDHSRVELYAVPLEHEYCKNSLSFNSLKGIDRSTANLISSLLGDFVEIHLAIVTKYIGYKDDDWITSGREHMIQKTQGKSPKHFRENDWVEHWAGNWVDLQNRRLILPPLSITVPDELLGYHEAVFHADPPHLGGKFDGHTFDRAAIIVWPRNQTFSTAISFGIDQALDVAESASNEIGSSLVLNESKTTQMQYLLALCKKESKKCWFASTTECSDLRCAGAVPVSLEVASKRVLRLINLCLTWNLPECGLDLFYLLFHRVDSTGYRCHQCDIADEPSAFVGGICSKEVAEKLAELTVMFKTWDATTSIDDRFKPLINQTMTFDLKQTGNLAYFATCLFHRQCFDAAFHVSDRAYAILTDFYLIDIAETQSTDTVVESCISMLVLIDGLPSEYSRLSQLLFQLKTLSISQPSIVLSWLQQADVNLLKSLPPYWDFYVDLVTKLETQLMEVGDPTSKYTATLEALEKSAAQLMMSFLKLQDSQRLDILIDSIANSKKQEARILLAAILTSRNIWAVPLTPSIEAMLVALSATRVQQLVRFKFPMFKWEQPDAILKQHPTVELFLHSAKESMTYSAFASEEEAQDFASKYFGGQRTVTGYSAKVLDIAHEADGVVSVTISKTPDIYESSLKQLASLEDALSAPSAMACPPSRGEEVKNPVEVMVKSPPVVRELLTNQSLWAQQSKIRVRKTSLEALTPPGKRSKRISLKNQLQQS